MHCPSCGQQQVSNETKFCNRCGMPLSVIAEVVSYGGYLPQLAELSKKEGKRSWLTRRNALGFTLIWFLFWLLILCPFFGIVGVEELAGVSAIVGIFGALIMLVSTFIFIKKDVKYARMDPAMFVPPQSLGGPAQAHALPPQQTMPASSYAPPQPGNWRDTNDLQPAVTESTTRLLDEEEQTRRRQ
jgi:amino acid transporter